MSKENVLDWHLIHKIMDGTATTQETAKWSALTEQQAAYAALIPLLRQVQATQQDSASPFYAVDAWQDFKARLPASSTTIQQTPPRNNVFRMWRKASVAAAVALLIGLCYWFSPFSKHSPAKTTIALLTYTVPNGQRKLITLPDNTHIWMNAGSSVKVPAAWDNDVVREVWLEGEGFFEVQENPARPFIVHTPATTVRVLGTSFNIEAYRQIPVAVTVATGKVQFSSSAGRSVTLTQNQRALLIAGVFQTTATDANLYSVWREGVLQFRDEPLINVFGKLERRFNVPMKIVGSIRADQYCTARFAAGESLHNILESLHHIYGLTITEKSDTIFITATPQHK